MLFDDTLCIVRGGGDLATGVIYRLHRAGFPVVVLELEQPRVVRRMAAVAQAVFSDEVNLPGLVARRMTLAEATASLHAASRIVPIVLDPSGEAVCHLRPPVLVDARMAKSPLDTTLESATFVAGLGPGFVAGAHCHAVVETNRGHDLGRVIWSGSAQPDTHTPEPVLGFDVDRVLRAPVVGRLLAHKEIGELIRQGEIIASVDGQAIVAPFNGVLRGLMYDGLAVEANEKVGDLDPRGRREYCFTISEKSLAVGGGVLEAVLTWLNNSL